MAALLALGALLLGGANALELKKRAPTVVGVGATSEMSPVPIVSPTREPLRPEGTGPAAGTRSGTSAAGLGLRRGGFGGITLTRNLPGARSAYLAGDAAASRAAHSASSTRSPSNSDADAAAVDPNQLSIATGGEVWVRNQEMHRKGGDRMKAIVFGGLDGIITTFAVVAGAGGGGLTLPVVLIMGFSSLIWDALSMGVGDALSSKWEAEVAKKERLREAWELENYREGEIEEMVELYLQKYGTTDNMSEEDWRALVEMMARYKNFFLDKMMQDELGMEAPEEEDEAEARRIFKLRDHWISGLYCFAWFMVCGWVPLLGFLVVLPFSDDEMTLFGSSVALTAVALFALGAAKSPYTTRSWYASGLEVLIVGSLCAAAAYGSGYAVEQALEALDLTDHNDCTRVEELIGGYCAWSERPADPALDLINGYCSSTDAPNASIGAARRLQAWVWRMAHDHLRIY